MARYKSYDYNQMVMVPVSLAQQLVPGTLEHTIHYIVEHRMDLKEFDRDFKNDETGRTAYDPKVLLKVVLLGIRGECLVRASWRRVVGRTSSSSR